MSKTTLIQEDYERLSNRAIVDFYLSNGLIRKCVEIQFWKLPKNDWWKLEFMDDFFQDLIVALMTYDNEKLNNAHHYNHMNAFITRVILNNIYSNSSRFYCQYLKLGRMSQEIDEKIENNYFQTEDER